MDSESSAAAKPSRGSGVTLPIFFVVLIIIGYALSAPPVVAFYRGKPPQWVVRFYAPVIYACNNVPTVQAFYNWYGPLWLKPPY